MQHQSVALDFPTKSEAPNSAAANAAARPTLDAAATAIYEGINSCTNPDQLEGLAKSLWVHHGQGKISDNEATYLASVIDRRRPLRHTALPHIKALGRVVGRLSSRFAPRQRQRSPDRKASRDRRRMLGGSSALPDSLRHHYTEGQRSVLCIVAGEIKRRGLCDFPIEKIAALAGVCRTTVQTTLHEARRLGHITIIERPQRGRKNLPNVLAIIPSEWRAWIRRAPSAARLIGSNSVKMVSPTKTTLNKKEAHDKTNEKRHETTKPPHGAKSKDGRWRWWDHGTSEWARYAQDYEKVHGAELLPKNRVGGKGNWFVAHPAGEIARPRREPKLGVPGPPRRPVVRDTPR